MNPKNHYHVPKSKTLYEKPKHKDFCVVIPVINEGQRIQDLLLRMQQLNIAAIADVIIIDGGSVDGSIEIAMKNFNWLNAVLLKDDVGKLSTQLLIGYAFAKDRDYKGTVTIDGNNKDSPAEIPLMIEKIKQGFDFVQASRFIKGGKHANTPLLRWIAIRLIHAPLLSISSGFKWTDTTQGFRAYSSKLLNDGELNIFRTCFKEYELLAYLNYRAPSLGLNCLEIPAERNYPSKGRTPTKISGLSALLKLLGVLMITCCGFYNQKTMTKK